MHGRSSRYRLSRQRSASSSRHMTASATSLLCTAFEIVGTVIPSLSTDVEPSAELIAELVELIEHEGVKAVFGETTVSERIARALAD